MGPWGRARAEETRAVSRSIEYIFVNLGILSCDLSSCEKLSD